VIGNADEVVPRLLLEIDSSLDSNSDSGEEGNSVSGGSSKRSSAYSSSAKENHTRKGPRMFKYFMGWLFECTHMTCPV
jgi:hypothetical protein